MRFPTPLENRHWWNPGAWLLPSASLSLASAFSFIIAFIIVAFAPSDAGNLIKIFTLPIDVLPAQVSGQSALTILALFSFFLSIFILVITAPRPSRFPIKLWSLLLVLLNLIVVGIVTLDEQPEWWWDKDCESCWWWTAFQNTAVLASLMASLILSLRLIKPRVDSHIIQLVTPVTLLFILPSVLLLVYYLTDYADESQRNLIAHTKIQLEKEVEDIENIFSNSSKTYPSIEQLISKTETLEKLLNRTSLSSQKLSEALEMAKLLRDGDNDKIRQSSQRIFDNINQLSNKYNFPILSDFEQSPFKYTKGKWEKNKQVQRYNNAIVSYYNAINLYLETRQDELNKSSLDNKFELSENFQVMLNTVKEQLEPRLNNWLDRWLIYQLPIIFNKPYSKQALINDLISMDIFNGAKLNNISSVIKIEGLQKIIKGQSFESKSCFKEGSNSFRCYAYNGNKDDVSLVLEFRAVKLKYLNIALLVPQINEKLSFNIRSFIKSINTANDNCIKFQDQGLNKKQASMDDYDNDKSRRIRLETGKSSC